MTTLDRRMLIAGALSAAAPPALAWAAPPNGLLRFAIFRNGKPFGSYSVSFASNGAATNVVHEVAMAMKIAGMSV